MLPGHKILLRYKTLDKCFRSSRKWSLEELINLCSKILGENISKRSIQSDIQFLRDNGAPIVVKQKKFYEYKDKTYSILKKEPPKKLEEQFIESIDFVKEISNFPKYNYYKETLLKIKPRKDKLNKLHYVKSIIDDFINQGFFIYNGLYSRIEIRKIINEINKNSLQHKESLIDNNKTILNCLLKHECIELIKKINPRAFLIDVIYYTHQEESGPKQTLELPLYQRNIPKNLTLWGYPAEEQYDKPDKERLYSDTFCIDVYLKNTKTVSGAPQVIQGSHKRELSLLEVNLISNNTFPTSCEVLKGGIFASKPLLIQQVHNSVGKKPIQFIRLWFSSYRLPVHYLWNNEVPI